MSVRPLYETDEQRARELAIAQRFARVWSCKAVQNKRAFAADFSFLRGRRVVALVEVKDRSDRYTLDTLDSFGGVMISLHKWANIHSLARTSGLPAVVALSTLDGLWFHRATKQFKHDGIEIGGREDRGDWQDVEPCALFRKSRFRRLFPDRPPPALFDLPPPEV